MNSPPRRINGTTVSAMSTAAMANVPLGNRSTSSSTGRYTAVRKRLTGFEASWGMRPRIR